MEATPDPTERLEADDVAELPTRLNQPGPTPSHATGLHLPVPETVLRRAEIEQALRTAIIGVVFSCVGLAVTPFSGGEPLPHDLFTAGVVVALVANLGLLYVSTSERRYEERYVVLYFALAPFFNTPILYYLGVFGPYVVVFVLNLYTACLGFGRRVAIVTLVGSVAPNLVLGGAIAMGWLADVGFLTVAGRVDQVARVVMVLTFAMLLYFVYDHGRRTRQVMVASLAERDEAVRRASHREALLLEARQDLERALSAGGMGRFTDQTLGSYNLGAVIGRGGMGEVYEATHVRSGERAAVKMLLPEVMGRPRYVQRFMREVRIAASIDSPHVVRVLEVGDESAPLPYLAMERLDGDDLAQILRRRGRLEPSDVIELVEQVGRGLTAAAESGIVHRDLKPQNLFRCAGEPPVWKILDFGVSKLVDGGGTLTQGDAVGTVHYMAPEQALGREVDLRADLYALGAVAYRALTGHQPFNRERGEILLAVTTEMPVRPTALVPLPRDVDLALAIALAKDPADRFASAAELAHALARALLGQLEERDREHARKLLDGKPWRSPA